MIAHLDMDAFYAAIEQLDQPALKGRCVIVGGRSKRGVVTTASYEARRFGIHSAMPMFQALQRCPQAVVIAPRRRRYKEISGQVMDILRRYTPLVEPVSIDEAYMDISGCRRLYGPPRQMAAQIKADIAKEIQLTCSIGIARLKFLAKIASDMQKPDGLTIIEDDQTEAFIAALPIQKVPGVGPAALTGLKKIGIHTLGDARHYSEQALKQRLGAFGLRLAQFARAQQNSPVAPSTPVKSVSREDTLRADTTDRARLHACLLSQCETVARRLRRHQVAARTVSLILKHSDFRRITRNTTLAHATCVSIILYHHACGLLADYRLTTPVRLIGVAAGNLQPDNMPKQADLFTTGPDSELNWRLAEYTMDAIAQRYGRDMMFRATLKQ